jgi:hypothetical protein
MEDTEGDEPSARDIWHQVAAWALFYGAGHLCSWAAWWAWAGVPLLFMTALSLLADFLLFIPPMKTADTDRDWPHESI